MGESSPSEKHTIAYKKLFTSASLLYSVQLVKQQRYEQANNILNAARKVSPNNSKVSSMLANNTSHLTADKLYYNAMQSLQEGDKSSAFKGFTSAIAKLPSHLNSKRQLQKLIDLAGVLDAKALRYLDNENLDGALATWHELLRFMPAHEGAIKNIARVNKMMERLPSMIRR